MKVIIKAVIIPLEANGSSIFQNALQGLRPHVLYASFKSCGMDSKALRIGNQAKGILNIRLANKIPENENTKEIFNLSYKKLPSQLPLPKPTKR